MDWSIELLKAVLDAAPEGIVICEAGGDHPVIYANPAFATLSGYDREELLGKNLRILQGADREQDAIARVREGLARGETVRALLRNYRKDGTPFWNEMLLQAVRGEDGAVKCFIGYHRDAGERLKAAERSLQGLPTWMREDRLTGLSSRAYFEELLRRDWAVATRENRSLGLAIFDVDALGAYNDTFGRAGGDAVLRRISRLIVSLYRRGSDLVGRWEGGAVAVLMHGAEPEKMLEHAQLVAQRVREQLIHHPRSSARYVTVSAGVATLRPARGLAIESLVRGAERAMRRAKTGGRNRVVVAEGTDFEEEPARKSAEVAER